MTTLGSRTLVRSLAIGLAMAVAACAASPASPPTARTGTTPGATGDVVAEAAALLALEGVSRQAWAGPADGVARSRARGLIVFVAADTTNGGIIGVYQGVQQAVAAMGWTVALEDGGARADGRATALRAAIAARPIGIVIGGFDPSEQPSLIGEAVAQGIAVVGWHAGTVAGPDPSSPLFTNVSTRPSDVALLAADYVIGESGGHAGVAIFTDSQYQIALDKANLMKAQIERCAGCRVLAFRDTEISASISLMPSIVRDLHREYGAGLTYLLAINGNYFAGSKLGLAQDGVGPRDPPYAVAAGDGDQAEFDRIRSGGYQVASVAEPLHLQGWQLVDEINRDLAGQAPSSYVAMPGLITVATVPPRGAVWDPDAGYQATYERQWGVGP